MPAVSEKYFSILKDYFSDLEQWTRKKKALGPASLNEIYKLYDHSLMKTILESLTEELLNLNWDAQTKQVERSGD
jgi:hypothetical protein